MHPVSRATMGSRALFPDVSAPVYANHAAISPPSLAVRAAVAEALADFARDGAEAFPKWVEHRRATKAALASLLGTEPGSLALVPNTTSGVLAIALCFPWIPGDRVVVFDGEFPTNITPWQQAATLFQLELEWLSLTPLGQPDGADLAELESALKSGVRLVAISAVQFQTGLRMPLRAISELCHAYGAQLFVDGIQAVGALPLDLTGIDYLAFGGHKWLMAPEGAGGLYCPPHRARELRMHLAGWLSHTRPVQFLFEGAGHLDYDRPLRTGIDVLESGTINTAGYAGLGASLALLNELTPARIFEHIQSWHDELEPKLTQRGLISLRAPDIERRSGILSFKVPDGVDPVHLHAHLAASGIACALPDGYLRFSPHWPNHLDEIPRIVEAFDRYPGFP